MRFFLTGRANDLCFLLLFQGIVGIMTNHLILWDPFAAQWYDAGPWIGRTGMTGSNGPTGATGVAGPSQTGSVGPTGVSFSC